MYCKPNSHRAILSGFKIFPHQSPRGLAQIQKVELPTAVVSWAITWIPMIIT